MKDLFLFTQVFPYDKGEEFLETEILFLAPAFRNIYLVPQEAGKVLRPLPSNVHVLEGLELFAPVRYSGLQKLRFLFPVLRILLYSFFRSPQKMADLKSMRHDFSYWLKRMELSRDFRHLLQKNKLDPGNCIAYTYWLTGWAECVALLRKKNLVDLFYSRAHGFDVYEEQTHISHFRWRPFVLEQAEMVFCISENGLAHLLRQNPSYESKFQLSYLGVSDTGEGKISEQQAALVSCSSLIPLKRVHLIVEVLKQVKTPLQWVHFGEGPEWDQLNVKASELPSHIQADFRGWKSNREVRNYYLEEAPELFIHMSESEGLPVSMMEAISSGTPVMAVKVGGIEEIVPPDTGWLLDLCPDIPAAAKAIDDYLGLSMKERQIRRSAARNHYLNFFRAEKNYAAFTNFITA